VRGKKQERGNETAHDARELQRLRHDSASSHQILDSEMHGNEARGGEIEAESADYFGNTDDGGRYIDAATPAEDA
jgi:hypothetical protein